MVLAKMTRDELKKLMFEDKEQILIDRMFYFAQPTLNEVWGDCRDGCCRCEYSADEFFNDIIDDDDLGIVEII